MNVNSTVTTQKVLRESLRCCIESCKSKPLNGKLLYPMPSGPTRGLWTDIIRRHNPNSRLPTTVFVCSDHFSDDQRVANGHLRGNAVPNIFPPSLRKNEFFSIKCQFCNQSFRSRKELHAHDNTSHRKEYSWIKIEVVHAAEARTATEDEASTPCSNCREFEQISEGIRKTRASLLKSIEELKTLQRVVPKRIKLQADSMM